MGMVMAMVTTYLFSMMVAKNEVGQIATSHNQVPLTDCVKVQRR